jgi:hypothetical protein
MLHIVVEDLLGNTAEESEGLDVPIHEGARNRFLQYYAGWGKRC